MTTIVVVRHGETPWNREGRMQGWAPVPLNDTGREQADAAGAWLADHYDVDAVHASDLLRTKETTERLVSHLHHAPGDTSYERAWRERDIGVYQGLTYDDVFDRFPEFGLGEAAVDAADRVPDSGESLVDVYERVTSRFESILADADSDETRLVVTHGGPVYMLLGHVEDLDIKTAVLDHSIDNCGVTVFEHADGETRAVEKNGRSWDD
jgi:probable phosphoglycerate mutase